MTAYPTIEGGFRIDPVLYDFVEQEALPGTGISAERFWQGLSFVLSEFKPRNQALLRERRRLQRLIDAWHDAHSGEFAAPAYQSFLRKIGYLVDEPDAFSIQTTNVDDEIARIAGPQLVVPGTNARYVLNAANARWGSLYDALYGTDAIAGVPDRPGYDRKRGELVIAFGRKFLDETVPLEQGSHGQALSYRVVYSRLEIELPDSPTALRDPHAFIGYRGELVAPSAILLRHHGLHIELTLDRNNPIGSTDPAGVADILLEAAVSTIVDGEDSVAVVDAADKVALYRN